MHITNLIDLFVRIRNKNTTIFDQDILYHHYISVLYSFYEEKLGSLTDEQNDDQLFFDIYQERISERKRIYGDDDVEKIVKTLDKPSESVLQKQFPLDKKYLTKTENEVLCRKAKVSELNKSRDYEMIFRKTITKIRNHFIRTHAIDLNIVYDLFVTILYFYANKDDQRKKIKQQMKDWDAQSVIFYVDQEYRLQPRDFLYAYFNDICVVCIVPEIVKKFHLPYAEEWNGIDLLMYGLRQQMFVQKIPLERKNMLKPRYYQILNHSSWNNDLKDFLFIFLRTNLLYSMFTDTFEKNIMEILKNIYLHDYNHRYAFRNYLIDIDLLKYNNIIYTKENIQFCHTILKQFFSLKIDCDQKNREESSEFEDLYFLKLSKITFGEFEKVNPEILKYQFKDEDKDDFIIGLHIETIENVLFKGIQDEKIDWFLHMIMAYLLFYRLMIIQDLEKVHSFVKIETMDDGVYLDETLFYPLEY